MNRVKRDFYDVLTAVLGTAIIISVLLGTQSSAISAAAGRLTQKTVNAVSDSEKSFADIFESDEQPTSLKRTVYSANPLDALTATPLDIQQLIDDAQKKSAKEVEDGKIIERKYTAADANARLGSITIRNNTDTQKNINFKKYYDMGADISVKDKSLPTVLIFHTHTTESYEMLNRGWYAQNYITRSKSSDRNMVRVGMEIKEQLEKAGYGVIHDTEIHDLKYTGAYDHSRVNVEKYLKEYPSIQVVLDIHRDAIEQDGGVRIKPTAEILGKKAAQLMIITGCQEGKVTDFPNWEYNLRFALRLHEQLEKQFPGLMRPLYFSQRKYNMNCSHNNLLIEVGSSSNTLDEAAFSGRLLGKALCTLLDGTMKKE